MSGERFKIIAKNKNAFFEYHIEERFECGIVLTGAELKSLMKGAVNLNDSFCLVQNGELFLKNCHISPYEKGSFFNGDPRRDRKLLLHRREIVRMIGKTREKGWTIVPLSLYFKGSLVKAEVALAQGKKAFDKRESIKEKDIKRDMDREISKYK